MGTQQTVAIDTLGRFDPLFNLSPDQIEDLALQTPIERLEAGAYLFREDDTNGQSFYLLNGHVRLSAPGQEDQTVSADTERAVHPLSSGQRGTAVAITPVEFIRIDSDLVDSMITWGQLATPEPEVVMTEDGIFTVDKGSWLKKMVKSPTFKNLPPANIEQLLDQLEPIRVPAGEVIIRQGDKGDYFYMIDQGVALVTRQTEDEEEESIELAELNEGSSFGEAALISDKPRNATVSMMSDGVLLRLSKDNFLTLLTEPNVQWISYEDAKSRVGKDSQWLDIRLPSEYGEGHMPGAMHIPVQQLHRRARDLDKNIHYICYCDSGRRSSAASFILKQYGLDAFVLKDGIHSVTGNVLVKD